MPAPPRARRQRAVRGARCGDAPAAPRPTKKPRTLRRGAPRPSPDGGGRDALVAALLLYQEATEGGGGGDDAADRLATALAAPSFVGDGPVWAAALAARAEGEGVGGVAERLRGVA